MIEMHSRNKEEKRKLIVHALPWEMCMYVHARKCSYASTFDQFEQTEIRRSTCIHEAGVLVAANSQRRVPVDYYFHQARPPEKEAYLSMFRGFKQLTLKETGWGPPSAYFVKMTHMYRVMVCLGNKNSRDVKGNFLKSPIVIFKQSRGVVLFSF